MAQWLDSQKQRFVAQLRRGAAAGTKREGKFSQAFWRTQSEHLSRRNTEEQENHHFKNDNVCHVALEGFFAIIFAST